MTLFADVINSFNEKLFQGNCYALLSLSMFEMYPIYKSPEIKQPPLFNPLKASTKSLELNFSAVILTPGIGPLCLELSPTFLISTWQNMGVSDLF